MDEKVELLRHTLATVAYRATRALEGAPEEFGEYAGAGRRPVEILAHMGDLFDWALTAVRGEIRWHVSTPLEWDAEVRRFFGTLEAFDAALAAGEAIRAPIDRLIQGPVADALTHVGQLAMLRRMAGCAARSENMYVAAIEVGRVGSEQAEAIAPFK